MRLLAGSLVYSVESLVVFHSLGVIEDATGRIGIGQKLSIRTVTTADTLLADDSVLLFNSASNESILLGAIASYPVGKAYTVKRIGAGNFTLTPSDANIDGGASLASTTAQQAITVVSDGTNWHSI